MSANRRRFARWSDRLSSIFGTLGPAALIGDIGGLSERDLGDIGARLDAAGRADRAMAALRSRGFGPIF